MKGILEFMQNRNYNFSEYLKKYFRIYLKKGFQKCRVKRSNDTQEIRSTQKICPENFQKEDKKMLCQPKVEGTDVEKENKLDRAILSFQKVELQLLLKSRFLRVFGKVC